MLPRLAQSVTGKAPMRSLRLPATLLVLLLGFLLAGCTSDNAAPTKTAAGVNPQVAAPALNAQLRPGDTMTISLLGIPEPITSGVQIDEQGLIRLQYIGAVAAAGLTTSELSSRIRDAYIEKKYYTAID